MNQIFFNVPINFHPVDMRVVPENEAIMNHGRCTSWATLSIRLEYQVLFYVR